LTKAPARSLPELTLGARLSLAQQPAGNPLLQHLYHFRNSISFRLTDQNMNVLGHHDESHDLELVSFAYLLEDSQEYIPPGAPPLILPFG
jgi:hypothetical protein